MAAKKKNSAKAKPSKAVAAKKSPSKKAKSASKPAKTKPAVKGKAAQKPLPKKAVAKKAPAKKIAVKPAPKKAAAPVKKAAAPKKPIRKVKPAAQPALPKKADLKAAPVKTEEPKASKPASKTKKAAAPAQAPMIEVSNLPKNKVRSMLISQPKPVETDKNPYVDLSRKYNVKETFRQFIRIEGLSAKDFRAQRVDILDHQAVILTSRLAVDHFFRMCNEMRVTVPETMKYFCINEATAYYLQKYIQYRKRKIFFGHQTIQDLVDVIKKNREEKFLLPVSDVHKEQILGFLDDLNIKYTKAVMYRTVSANLSDIKDLKEYDLLVFFTPAGIRSLKHNFPNFKQNDTRIACFGATAAAELKQQGYRLDIYAPNAKNPSMSGAIDDYLRESNKR